MRCKSPLQADKILAAAAGLFATHRFHEARMEDIAAAAAVGKGTLYRYFKDKEELYIALLDRAADGISQRIYAAITKADATPALLFDEGRDRSREIKWVHFDVSQRARLQ